MARYKDKSVCVVDNGLFVELALTLARDFGRVYFFAPYSQGGYPRSNALLVGKGLPNVRRVESIWPILDEVDLWVMPDVYFGALAVFLADTLGKRVWSGRMGEELELDRVASKEHCDSLGIDIGPYKIVRGLDDLREYLQEHDNQFVKVSKTRGDFETFRSDNFALIEPRLDELEHTLGAKKKIIEFVVEEAIEPAVEIGYDGWTISGQFSKKCLLGIEVKDRGFIARTKAYDDLPVEVRSVNDKLAKSFAAWNWRGFFSSECRITPERRSFLIDPCARMGSPPGELMQLMISNLAEIIWEGADGNVVEPEYIGKWGAQLVLLSEWADKNWLAVQFPKSIRENIKLRNLAIIENKYYVAPQMVGQPEVGAIVAVADTCKDAVDECQRIADLAKGYYLETVANSLETANDEIATLKSYGIDF